MIEEHIGFQWSRLYSKIHKLGNLAELFVESEPYPAKLQSFANNVLAEPWTETIITADRSKIKTVGASDYVRGEIPKSVQILTAAVDIHKKYFRWAIRGWGYLGTSWLIDYGSIYYDPLRFDWPAIETLLFPPRDTLDGRRLPITWVMIDSGYEESTDQVYRFAMENPSRVRATKGDGQIGQPWIARVQKNVGVILWHVKPGYYKDMLFGKLLKGPEDDGALHFPMDVGDDYFDELCSQKKERVQNRRTGKTRYQWGLRKGILDDHILDCEVLNFAAGDILGVISLGAVDAPSDIKPTRAPQWEDVFDDRKASRGDEAAIAPPDGDWLDW